MNNKTLHIIGNEFTRDFYREDPVAWWTHRLDIYEHFCLASLKNQTNKNFLLTMMLKGYSVNFKDRIIGMLENSGLKYAIRVIGETTHEEMMRPFSREYDTVYHTRIDTDDMFHKDAVDEIQSYEYDYRRALVFQKGYCYDVKNNRLQHYFMPGPPFSTIMFPMDVYVNEEKQAEYKGFKSHDALINTMPYLKLSENKFVVNVHGTNRITIYQNDRTIFRGHENETEIDSEQDKIEILKNFGILTNTYQTKVLKQ